MDNLLNFAGTVRGLLCLQQTGALRKCVKYMFSRYIKKLQVSKYEKFGYGMMLTQVAGTACGMAALMDTGEDLENAQDPVCFAGVLLV